MKENIQSAVHTSFFDAGILQNAESDEIILCLEMQKIVSSLQKIAWQPSTFVAIQDYPYSPTQNVCSFTGLLSIHQVNSPTELTNWIQVLSLSKGNRLISCLSKLILCECCVILSSFKMSSLLRVWQPVPVEKKIVFIYRWPVNNEDLSYSLKYSLKMVI